MDEPGNLDILLVEDSPEDAELALRALGKCALADRITWVKDGAEALEFVFCTGAYAARPDRDPNLILLDLKLPKLDGIEVLKRVKSDGRTRGIPVVMLTASAAEHDIAESYKLGAISCLVKPVDFKQVSEAVAKAVFYRRLMQ